LYVLVYILGTLVGTKGSLGWTAVALQGCGPAEMLKGFHSSHLPQLEPQGLPGSTMSPAEQGWYPGDAQFHPSHTDPGLKPVPALERGPLGHCKGRRLLHTVAKAGVPKGVIWAAGKYRCAFRCRRFFC